MAQPAKELERWITFRPCRKIYVTKRCNGGVSRGAEKFNIALVQISEGDLENPLKRDRSPFLGPTRLAFGVHRDD